MAGRPNPGTRRSQPHGPIPKRPKPAEQAKFLKLLAAGSTVTAAMDTLGLDRRGVYCVRREDPAFLIAWEEARDSYLRDLRQPVLDALAAGSSLAQACRDAGVPLGHIQSARRKDPVFREEFERALEDGCDRLEDEALRRSVEGVDKPVFQGGRMVGVVREYSDGLLTTMLRARRPERFATRRDVKVTANVGVPVEVLDSVREHGLKHDLADAFDQLAAALGREVREGTDAAPAKEPE